MPELLGTNQKGTRVLVRGTEQKLRKLVQQGEFTRWAIYRDFYKGRPFHNATDPDYLIAHDDPYWHNVFGTCPDCGAGPDEWDDEPFDTDNPPAWYCQQDPQRCSTCGALLPED